MSFQWTRSETIALADQGCPYCFGLGVRPSRAGNSEPCNCVLRAIFRACHSRFRAESMKELPLGRLTLGGNGQRKGASRRGLFSMRSQEFRADFVLTAKRVLGEDTHLYRVFKWHFLLGADCPAINRKLGRKLTDRDLYHDYYRIEAKLGRAFRELQPYSLWPLDEYFHGTTRSTREGVSPAPQFSVESEPGSSGRAPLRFPTKKASEAA